MASLLLSLIYISFISLGLPDAILGSAWPVMYREFGVQVSDMGILSMTMSLFTIISSLNVQHLTSRFGPAKVTAFSVALTAAAIFGFSCSDSFLTLFLWTIPYGLGAGCVDAALNNYVALHFASRHMNWLHCMWGVGACTGPYVMGYALSAGATWNAGYFYVGIFQTVLCLVLLTNLGVWRIHEKPEAQEEAEKKRSLRVGEVFTIPGVWYIMLAFFAYCALEQTAGQWASSYFVMEKGVAPEAAASLASLFYMGITVGRGISGFLTIKLNDRQMLRLGQTIMLLGVLVLFLPLGELAGILGMAIIGLGCAPIYPCVIHTTPELFGKENSQAIIGVQMAFAYMGSLFMPPLYGLIAQYISAALLPVYLLAMLVLMIGSLEILHRRHRINVAI